MAWESRVRFSWWKVRSWAIRGVLAFIAAYIAGAFGIDAVWFGEKIVARETVLRWSIAVFDLSGETLRWMFLCISLLLVVLSLLCFLMIPMLFLRKRFDEQDLLIKESQLLAIKAQQHNETIRVQSRQELRTAKRLHNMTREMLAKWRRLKDGNSS